jgi:hypothetical protein
LGDDRKVDVSNPGGLGAAGRPRRGFRVSNRRGLRDGAHDAVVRPCRSGDSQPFKAGPVGHCDIRVGQHKLGAALASAVAQIPAQTVALEAIADSATEESAYAALLLDWSDAEARSANDLAPGDHRAFVEVARDRRRTVLDTLRTSGVEQAKFLLRQWRDATAAAVGVT